MKTYTKEELTEILWLHRLWINADTFGVRADLRYADLRYANLSSADLRSADLRSADLRYANLSSANLRSADLRSANLRSANLRSANLRYANLSSADLSSADLSSADLSFADLRYADLSSANLSSADLRSADLRYANLSRSTGLLISNKWMDENFKSTEFGYLVYKTFGAFKVSPEDWKIESGNYIEEVVNQNPVEDCGCGINFATMEWIKYNVKDKDIWECLIEWKDACTITVPYNTDGKARCGRMKLIKIVKP